MTALNKTSSPTRKRILREIKLDRIAAVDMPCQEHALVTIMKRDPEAPAANVAEQLSRVESLLTKLKKKIKEGANIVRDRKIEESLRRDGKEMRGAEPDDTDENDDEYASLVSDDDDQADDDTAASDEQDTEDQQVNDDEDQRSRKVAKRHKFESVVDRIAERDGVPKTKAASTARSEQPTLYEDYVSGGDVAKNYNDLVAAEMRKGCTAEVSASRVQNFWPHLAKAAIAKSNTGAAAFVACVDSIMKTQNCNRTDAMQRARVLHPNEFRRFQNV